MCGISGFIAFQGCKIEKYIKDIEKMNSMIQHRGPDGEGVASADNFVFGHTRLAIIDTSVAGHQPMQYASRFTITYNGEVYNYLELREELIEVGYSFSTQTDTEVILAAYAAWGEGVTARLNGMFAFVIHDARDNSFFIARDRSGVKPLYYCKTDQGLYFFSEPKQVVLTNIFPGKPNLDVIEEYLSFQFSLSEKTFFDGINKLLPGHTIKIKDNKMEFSQYWSIDSIVEHPEITEEIASKQLKELVTDSVKMRLRADVPLGCYLSGGIDSSIVSAVASSFLDKINTYTFTSKNSPATDESDIAKKTSEAIGSNHHEIELDLSNVLTLWKQSVYFMDEPVVGYSLLPQMEISKAVGKDLKVVLGGQGGDELFYGYAWHTELFKLIQHGKVKLILNSVINLFKLKQGGPRARFKKFIGSMKHILNPLDYYYFNLWVSNGVYSRLSSNSSKVALKSKFLQALKFNNDMLSIKKFEYKHWLPALLQVEDRSSMYASIESRVPLLDYRIAEYAFRLMPTRNIDGVLNKAVFIKSFNKELIDDVKYNKYKKGYASPINSWLKDIEVSSFTSKILNDSTSFIYQFVSFSQRKKFTTRQVWLLINVEIWFKVFVKRTIKIND